MILCAEKYKHASAAEVRVLLASEASQQGEQLPAAATTVLPSYCACGDVPHTPASCLSS
jgi:hypothetical protein